ncbi:hypothetical protein A7U60_g8203 [Sanghuangporus baumii]|uniref:Uncharacterized protein n=1 Tax=Sanghuangporus baumii TaxID=108892 RepID=A0A9Q5HRJ5_SANBA|nr:hypothetical protein A7U60_g8203 [Sanghuangporus baumii]
MDSKPPCSSQMQPRTDRVEDEETSSLSDYDSEWTQVSGAEDDSDYPPLSAVSDRPLSRVDTFDGSIDGDLWEGLMDGIRRSASQSSDQTHPSDVDIDATEEVPPDSEPLSEDVVSRTHEDDTDNDALDSELIGTLTASRARSASASLRASLSESQSKLRLSFPDPLSSRELGAKSDHQDTSAPPSSVEEHCENTTADVVSSFAEVNLPLTPSDSDPTDEMEATVLPIPASAPCVLLLSLYGSSNSSKWQIAERIMKLILRRADNARSMIEDGSFRDYYFDSSLDAATDTTNEQFIYVRVFDRTSSLTDAESPDIDDHHVSSVAILLLPSRLPAVLPKHKFYLPLLSLSSLDLGFEAEIISSTFSEQVMLDSAHYTWKKLDLAREDVIILDRQRPRAILDASTLEAADSNSLIQAFSVVLNKVGPEDTSVERGSDSFFTNKWYTIALVVTALIAITIGGIQASRGPLWIPRTAGNTSSGLAIHATTHLEPAKTVVTLMAPANHLVITTESLPHSLATTIAKTTACASHSSSYRVSDASGLTDVSHSVVSSIPSSSITGTCACKTASCRSRARSWVDKLNLSLGEYITRDLIVRPVDTLGFVAKKDLPYQKPHRSHLNARSFGGPVKSLSLRTVQNSLAVVSSKCKAIKEMAGKDMVVLHEAIDELLRSLGRQIDAAKDEMKDAKLVAQSSFSLRNARAKENAQRLRRAGEHLVQAAGSHLRSKGEEAINVARKVRDRVREFAKFH